MVEKVKPERDKITKQIHEECFWKFWDKRAKNFEEVAGHKEYLVKARDSTEWAFAYVSKNFVISSKVVIFKDNSLEFFALLQGCAHRVWCESDASTIGRAITYNPTLGLERFPFPKKISALSDASSRYLAVREQSMSALVVGMNALYRLTHLVGERSNDVAAFRHEIQSLDNAVISAYGWDDLDLEHGFHEVPYLPENDRVRFTISETARVEVLRRLSELNRQRYEEEVAQGLHGNTAPRTSTPKRRRTSADVPQPSLDFGTLPANEGHYLKVAEPRPDYRAGPAHAIVEHLKAHPGWHAKSDILAATGITDGQWNTAINELLASGKVERQGERRGARYRVLGDES